ncbi:hypothetical protein Ancab_021281 [Ancistrocladus abbreviatus]
MWLSNIDLLCTFAIGDISAKKEDCKLATFPCPHARKDVHCLALKGHGRFSTSSTYGLIQSARWILKDGLWEKI